jgi:acylphosphatase
MAQRRIGLRIRGIVQGVCYRACAQTEAVRLGLTGWVANRPDGSVELVAEGEQAALEELAAWCRRGPPHAQVFDLDQRWAEPTDDFTRFTIVR